jgi:hypothetical protein
MAFQAARRQALSFKTKQIHPKYRSAPEWLSAAQNGSVALQEVASPFPRCDVGEKDIKAEAFVLLTLALVTSIFM